MLDHTGRIDRRQIRKELIGRIALVIFLGIAIWLKWRIERDAPPPPRDLPFAICEGC